MHACMHAFSGTSQVQLKTFLNFLPAGTADIHNFFEGDIILTPAQKKEIEMSIDKPDEEEENEMGQLPDQHPQKRAIVKYLAEKWSNGVVPYTMSSSIGKFFCLSDRLCSKANS